MLPMTFQELIMTKTYALDLHYYQDCLKFC